MAIPPSSYITVGTIGLISLLVFLYGAISIFRGKLVLVDRGFFLPGLVDYSGRKVLAPGIALMFIGMLPWAFLAGDMILGSPKMAMIILFVVVFCLGMLLYYLGNHRG